MDARASKKRKSSSSSRAVRRQALQSEEPNIGAEVAQYAPEIPLAQNSQLENGKSMIGRKTRRVKITEPDPIGLLPSAESSKDASTSSISPRSERKQLAEGQSHSPRKQSRKRKAGSAQVEAAQGELKNLTGSKRKPESLLAGGTISASPLADPAHAEIKLLREENARLQREIVSKDAALNEQKETISYIYGQCTCTVCMELVWRPHVLSPCGHVFCARCLVAWFTKPLADEFAPQMEDAEEQRAAERRRTLRRVKVCPHCRERVSVAPAEVWLIKGLVEKIDSSMRKGQGNEEHLVQGVESFAGLSEHAKREAKGGNLPASKIIWNDIFPEEQKNEPMFDEEDRVYRCTFCANEVVNGACTSPSCGMLYNVGHLLGFDSDESFVDEDLSEDDLLEFSEEDDEDDGFIDDAPIEVYDSEDESYFARHNIGDRQGNGPDEENDSSSSSSVEEITAPHRVPRFTRQIDSDSDTSIERNQTHITIDDETDYESDGAFDEAEDLTDAPTGEDTYGEMDEGEEDDVDDDEAVW